ncbi:XkdX family protein [Cytobacillus sp. IB215665]|nr:XkdX family protein [Cytobacillus sp. IB215665]MDX8367797.1 XkdX family protein [Cytobacillus sp. IB215665]
MAFWKLAYSLKWVSIDKLRLVVKTDANPHGEITEDEFKQITNEDFAL